MNSTTNHLLEIQHLRFLTDNTFILRFNRENIQFKSGQYITIKLKEFLQQREYSIYSGENENYIEILVRKILNGFISLKLENFQPGELIEINGPFGFFKLNAGEMYSRSHIFIASGTGIAPFHSMIASNPGIDYTIIHGVRYINEAYDKNDYDPGRYILCTSGEKDHNFFGRITSFLKNFKVEPDMMFYLCGNGNMIYDVYDILRKKSVLRENIYSEVYF